MLYSGHEFSRHSEGVKLLSRLPTVFDPLATNKGGAVSRSITAVSDPQLASWIEQSG